MQVWSGLVFPVGLKGSTERWAGHAINSVARSSLLVCCFLPTISTNWMNCMQGLHVLQGLNVTASPHGR